MARVGAERIGTPGYYVAYSGRFSDSGYLLKTLENADLIKQAIEEDFGSLPEIDPLYHNYHDETSPDFATFTVVAYNRNAGHALFRGSVGQKLHLSEYYLENRERKAFSRRGLVFPASESNASVTQVKIMQADGDFRKVNQFYFHDRRKPSIMVRFTHGGYSDYEGENLIEAGFNGNKLSVVDLFYRRQVEEAKPQPKVQEPVKREYQPGVYAWEDFLEILASQFPDPNETLPTEPPEHMRFELKAGSKIMLIAYDYAQYYDQTKRIGEVFNPEWIKPFIVATSLVGDRLRLQRLQRSGSLWDILTPAVIDNQLVANTALDRALAWRDLNTVLPVTFDMYTGTVNLNSPGRSLEKGSPFCYLPRPVDPQTLDLLNRADSWQEESKDFNGDVGH